MKKLNLGSGNELLQGYINIDLYNPKADLKHDLTKPLPFEDGSVDEIYAKHIIEHFTVNEWIDIKKDWYRVLKVGGKLTIECPDIVRCMKHFLADTLDKRWDFWIKTIYGHTWIEGQSHRNGFDYARLAHDLKEEGFKVTYFSWLWDNEPDEENGFNLKMIAIKEK